MKSLKRILLAVFLIVAGLQALGFGFPFSELILGISGIVAGILYLIQK